MKRSRKMISSAVQLTSDHVVRTRSETTAKKSGSTKKVKTILSAEKCASMESRPVRVILNRLTDEELGKTNANRLIARTAKLDCVKSTLHTDKVGSSQMKRKRETMSSAIEPISNRKKVRHTLATTTCFSFFILIIMS